MKELKQVIAYGFLNRFSACNCTMKELKPILSKAACMICFTCNCTMKELKREIKIPFASYFFAL